MSKKLMTWTAVLTVLLLLCTSCSLKRMSSLNDYGAFFNEKYYIHSTLEMFPQTIEEDWVVEGYEFWYRELFWEDAYIYLDIKFPNREQYNQELERIFSIEGSYYDESDRFTEDTENFHFPAYVLRNDSTTSEYILTMQDECRLVYIFLQKAPTDSIRFPENYLPKFYDCK